jgi:hypothetical protein
VYLRYGVAARMSRYRSLLSSELLIHEASGCEAIVDN